MKRSIRGIISTVLIFVILCPLIDAAEEDRIEYDIFLRGDTLSVWIDLSFMLSAGNLKKLLDGIDLALEYRLTLATPRRLWGSRTVVRTDDALKISYRQITEDFYVSSMISTPDRQHRFISREELEEYLKDSILVGLADIDSLDSHQRYTLEIEITSITLTALNLLSDGSGADSTQSALKSLFKEFLKLTGYGRRDLSVKSRAFSLEEIFPGP
ncbi:MAG: DUF4390 domain-containing protein [candidate division Zixibacteria bacterium]|nr:DUF4390 domain-containing protein [candidate division Zixibacteria bacterium]